MAREHFSEVTVPDCEGFRDDCRKERAATMRWIIGLFITVLLVVIVGIVATARQISTMEEKMRNYERKTDAIADFQDPAGIERRLTILETKADGHGLLLSNIQDDVRAILSRLSGLTSLDPGKRGTAEK